jgi:tetratricopeptide (TPR) repeat protein
MPFAARFHLNYLISARPLDPELYAQRAGMNAEMELWNDAEQDFKRAEQLGKNDPASLCQQAYVALALGNTNDYRRLCAALNNQAPQVKDQNTRNTLCWTVALLPNALENYATITETAQSAVKQGSYHQQSLQALGAVLYRTGNWEQSIKTLQGNAGLAGEKSVVESWIIIGMAHHQLGHKQDALSWLQKAQKWIAESMPSENRSPAGYHISWQRRQDISHLMSEAKALIAN